MTERDHSPTLLASLEAGSQAACVDGMHDAPAKDFRLVWALAGYLVLVVGVIVLAKFIVTGRVL